MRFLFQFLFFATLMPVSSFADLVVPNDGYVGEYHVVFTTSTSHQGDFGGIAGADAIVQARGSAGTATMGLTYKAIISDSTQNANSIIADAFPVYRTDGTRVANSYADMFTSDLLALVSLTENGEIAESLRKNLDAWWRP